MQGKLRWSSSWRPRALPRGQKTALLGGLVATLALLVPAAVAISACDGTLTGTHQSRGTLPALSPEPLSSNTARAPDGPAQIAARHLLVMHRESRSAPPTMLRTRGEARARAEKALAAVQNGAVFEDIVAEYSDEPGAAERGGDLSKFARKQMVKKFSDAAFQLKVGEISAVVETEFGFHVIKRTE